MKVLLTGAKGQLGRELIIQCQKKDLEFIATDVVDLDITNVKQVYDFVKDTKPSIIINCAAHTAVDRCESEADLAYKINAIGAKNLACAANMLGGEIVQVSTDYVFDGEGHKPYTEFDKVNPQTVYGRTKLAGEEMVRSLNPKHYIVRTAWLYGDGNNFVKTIASLGQKNGSVKVVQDQIGTPTSTVDLAKNILRLVEEKNYGTFHCTCKGQCSWYDFTKEIFKLADISAEVIPCTTEEFPRPAKRPHYSVLQNYMLELTIGDTTREWQEAIAEYLLKEKRG